MATSRSLSIVAVVCATAFFGVLNASAVTVVVPELGREWSVAPDRLGWVMTGFLLTYGVAIPIYGRLSDRWGADRLYLLGLGLFSAGSLACGLAPSFDALLGARVLQALGGAAFPGLGMTLATRAVPEQQRGVALGAIAATMGVGSAVGPLLGGLLADLWSWRVLFMASAGALMLVPIGVRVLPRQPRGSLSIDLLGGAGLAATIAGALLALSFGGTYGWHSAPTLVAGAVSLVAALSWHHRQRTAPEPFVPAALLRNRGFRRVVLVGFLASAANLAALVGFPLLLAGANEASSLQIAWVMLPGAVGTAVMGVVAGRLTDAIGGRRPILVGVSALAGVMILASAWAGVSLGAMAVCAGLLGFGFALVNTPLSATLARLVEPDELALALSLNVMAFFVGGSFGTTALLGIASFDAGTSAAGIASGFSAAFGWLVVPMVVALGLAWGLPRGAR